MTDSFKYLNPGSTMIVKSLIARARPGSIPWTPLRRPLDEATIALISSAGLSLRGAPPFDAEGERRNPWWGDPSYRVIPSTARTGDVVASHLHIETKYIESDLNVALPTERLAELVSAGVIGRAAPSHYSFMGYLLDPTEFLQVSLPAMIERMRREDVDAAVFVPV